MWDLLAPGTQTIQIRRVQANGNLSLLYVGGQRLAGLTEPQAEQAINASSIEKGESRFKTLAVSVLILEPAPPDAAKLDLPDEPLNPPPSALQWLYDDGGSGSQPVINPQQPRAEHH